MVGALKMCGGNKESVNEKEVYKWLPNEIRDKAICTLRTKTQARVMMNSIRALITAYDIGSFCFLVLLFNTYY